MKITPKTFGRVEFSLYLFFVNIVKLNDKGKITIYTTVYEYTFGKTIRTTTTTKIKKEPSTLQIAIAHEIYDVLAFSCRY